MTISVYLELMTQLDGLLTKIIRSGDRDAASLNIVTEIGEQLCVRGGPDLMYDVLEIFRSDPSGSGERRAAILGLCWEGIGNDEDDECFVASKPFQF